MRVLQVFLEVLVFPQVRSISFVEPIPIEHIVNCSMQRAGKLIGNDAGAAYLKNTFWLCHSSATAEGAYSTLVTERIRFP